MKLIKENIYIYTSKSWEGSPAAMAMFLDVFDEFLVFLGSPRTFLHTILIRQGRPSHICFCLVSLSLPLSLN